ncbi:hypothetical protein [Marinitoga lauensis]|uniref:hypothetical protein n=1 Tax=Marinitoga lauensis TaxID=2201189 RepID=UPI0010106893|nr:hypothetical protein [Marinitoga lauensis]
MIFNNKEQIKQLARKIYKNINSNVLKDYWNDFKPLPVALYDKKEVYIIGFPNNLEGFKKENDIFIGKWNSKFLGNSAIKYDNIYIAIFDLTTLNEYTTFEKLYSLIVHEIFHGFQLTNNDKRFANEFLFFQYPFKTKNIALRLEERKYLLKAVFENNKKENIKKFISYREKRRELIKDFLNYELGLESIEGTATYVEFKALADISDLPEQFLLAQFGKNLNDIFEYKNFRHSCYSSGCILLYYLIILTLNGKRNIQYLIYIYMIIS